ncbi:MAG: bacillithiol biosynthesis cysteine-adding enzyme BshC [Acidobacteriota bacterium]|nr:bacillithiol biosynthesis cysteine-adding enzyme BshC [Acidobacteriota bacterium]
MTNASSPPAFRVPASRFAPGLAGELLAGDSAEMIAPLRFLRPGQALDAPARAGERAAIAAELARANQSYGHPRAEELAARFADPQTRIIVTGQQAGVLGGPLYSLTKMIGAARWAAQLEEQGIPAVGVFWVATEDHDFREVAVANTPGSGQLSSFGLGDDLEPLMPVGMRILGTPLESLLRDLREAYPSGADPAAWELLESCYRPDARFGEAFSKFMVGLLGERAPLVLDSMLPAMKNAQRPWLRRLVERRDGVCDALNAAAGRVERAGRRPQVKGGDRHSALFLIADGARRRVVWHGDDQWSLRGVDAAREPVETLLARIDENPSAVSPGVLARPAIQDAVLGSSLQLMGPGEVAYLAQAASLYPVLGIEAPHTTLRPQMLVFAARQRKYLDGLGLGLSDLLGSDEALERRLAPGCGAEEADALREQVLGEIERLKETCVGLDPNLERPWQKTRDNVDRALAALSTKMCAAAVRRDEVVHGRLESLRDACAPGGSPQERSVCVAHYALRHGLGFGAAAYNQLEVGSDLIQIVDPESA